MTHCETPSQIMYIFILTNLWNYYFAPYPLPNPDFSPSLFGFLPINFNTFPSYLPATWQLPISFFLLLSSPPSHSLLNSHYLSLSQISLSLLVLSPLWQHTHTNLRTHDLQTPTLEPRTKKVAPWKLVQGFRDSGKPRDFRTKLQPTLATSRRVVVWISSFPPKFQFDS